MSALGTALVKALQLLLVVKVIAAPCALCPADGDGHWRTLVATRICAWVAYQSSIGGSSSDAGQVVSGVTALRIGVGRHVAYGSHVARIHQPGFAGRTHQALAHLRC